MTESVTGQDLRAMLDTVNAGYEDEPTEGLPSAVLEGLRQLVPCDSVSFFELDPGHRHCGGHGCIHDPGLAPAFCCTTGVARLAATQSAAATSQA